jgi:hypothetical protein
VPPGERRERRTLLYDFWLPTTLTHSGGSAAALRKRTSCSTPAARAL